MDKLQRLVSDTLGRFAPTVELVEHVVVGEGVQVRVHFGVDAHDLAQI